MDRAVLYLRPSGALPERQARACLDYADRHRYHVDSVTSEWSDAAALVEAGTVAVVVTAHGGDDRPLDQRVRAAGGRLEYARPPAGRARLDVASLAVGMYQRGAGGITVISHLLDAPSGEVRSALRRAGILRPAE